MDMEWVIACNKLCADILKPDINVFIDVPPEVCMQRIISNREVPELFETTENLRSVRSKYFEAFEKFKDLERIAIIDGNRPVDVIASDIRALF
jgi:dTMP kinase